MNAPDDTPAIGATMPDGSIYAGISPDTGQAMYSASNDSPRPLNLNEAVAFAANLRAHGHRDWRVPTKAELNLLFEHHHAIGGFDTSGSDPGSWYWSSTTRNDTWWMQRFSDGKQSNYASHYQSSLRCVRG